MRYRKARNVLVAVSIFFLLSPDARTASFDCNKARSPSEVLICDDAELSKLDDELSALYLQAKTATKSPSEFKRKNDSAWQAREATCRDKACLLSWYDQRRTQLLAELNTSAKDEATKTPAQSFFLRKDEHFCHNYGWLSGLSAREPPGNECFMSILKPTRIVVMDVDLPHVFICQMIRGNAGRPKDTFMCGYAWAKTIVTGDGKLADIEAMRRAASTATMADVRKLPVPKIGCGIDPSVANC